ncbi:MAG: YbaB/EbfC family nucleoid-associated protein [Candidatus Saccharimonadales bacterium]
MAFDQMKMLNDLRKAQKELKKQKVVVAAGGDDDDNPQVEITINGELKVEKVTIDSEQVDLEDIADLEHNLEIAFRDGMQKAQEIAAEKMKPLMGGLGNLGL